MFANLPKLLLEDLDAKNAMNVLEILKENIDNRIIELNYIYFYYSSYIEESYIKRLSFIMKR